MSRTVAICPTCGWQTDDNGECGCKPKEAKVEELLTRQELFAAMSRGEVVEARVSPFSGWNKFGYDMHNFIISNDHEYRLKPAEPKYEPWTFDDNILGVEVTAINRKLKGHIAFQNETHVQLGGHEVSYKSLLEFYRMAGSGEKCGRRAE